MSFYDNYISLCNRAEKSPSAVALEIGLTKPTITRWKNGSTPTDATMCRVADYFDVPLDYLKCSISIPEGSTFGVAGGSLLEPEKKTVGPKADGLQIAGYYQLTPANQAMIDALIDSLLKSQSEQ